MPHLRRQTGQRGEGLVALHLEQQGFQILARNARLGRLEIDLIAKRDGLVAFCEVRSRQSDAFLHPAASLTREKVARVRQAAALWLRQNPQSALQLRFDAAAVIFDRDPPRIEYFESAF